MKLRDTYSNSINVRDARMSLNIQNKSSEQEAKFEFLRKKRGAFDIMSDIIANIPSSGIRKTLLANKSMLDYRVFEKYLEIMIKDGLISYDPETMKIHVTEQGIRFYEQWKMLKELVKKTNTPY